MQDYYFDIIIIGAGTAGMPCAIQAAQRGKKVLVIEKDNQVGGTLHITAGHLSAAGTKRQSKLGISDDVKNHLNDVIRISKNTMDLEIAKKAIELAPETINWLEDLGYAFHEKAPCIIHGHDPYSIARTYFGKDDISSLMKTPGKCVLNALLPIWEKYLSSGLITLLLEHELTEIIAENKAIVGVKIKKNKGEIEIYNAKKYVITTGGYASNPYYFSKKHDTSNRLISSARHTSTGDGAIALEKIGAQFINADKHSSTVGGIELEPGSGRVNFWETWAKVSNGFDRKQREIYVNEDGVRFMNEFDLTADEREKKVAKLKNNRFYIIFDEYALHDGNSIIAQLNAKEIIAEAKKEKAIWQADTLIELAQKITIPIEALQSTIKKYNNFVTNQLDTEFERTYLEHKVEKAPFYAILAYSYSLISFGGIKVNKHLQVLDVNQNEFENLFAAGEILGAGATSGKSFCGGMLLTPAISFGKWLGDSL